MPRTALECVRASVVASWCVVMAERRWLLVSWQMIVLSAGWVLQETWKPQLRPRLSVTPKSTFRGISKSAALCSLARFQQVQPARPRSSPWS